jgi:hypothetical protein
MSRLAALIPLLILTLSCDNREDPFTPASPSGTVVGLTAEFDSLQVSLDRVNPSWFSKNDAAMPEAGTQFVTLLLHVSNRSSSTRIIKTNEFLLTTFDHNEFEHSWLPLDNGRDPVLAEIPLAPSEERDAWLTFSVSQDTIGDILTSQVLESLIWSPVVGLDLAIPFPSGATQRIYEIDFFGRVTDALGNPLPGANVTIVPLNPYLHPFAEVLECQGGQEPPQQLITDAAGWYEGVLRQGPAAYELCISVFAVPPEGSNASPVDSSGLWVKLGSATSFSERPELRVDLILPQATLYRHHWRTGNETNPGRSSSV